MWALRARGLLASSGCACALALHGTSQAQSQHPDAVFYEELEKHRLLRLSLLAEAQLGEWYEVKRLIDRGDVADEADAQGITALHLAARDNKKNVAEWLLGAGARCDARDAQGRSAAAYAAAAGNPQLVSLLLASPYCPDAQVNERDRAGASLLGRAAAAGALSMVRHLLKHPHCDPNLPDLYGAAPLHKATAFGHEQVVAVLLADARTQIDLPVAEPTAPGAHEAISGGESALLLAAGHSYYDSHSRHTAIAKALLAAGACPNAADKRGRAAAHRACDAGNEAIVKLLLRAKGRVDWTAQDAHGHTAYELAARAGHAGIASLLREHGCAHGSSAAQSRSRATAPQRRQSSQ